MKNICLTPSAEHELRNGAALVISTSGGKDSDAMTTALLAQYQDQVDITLLHCDLGRAEWDITPEYITRREVVTGIRPTIIRAAAGDLITVIRNRMDTLRVSGKLATTPPWPSPKNRYCTSDLKRSVTDKWIRNTFPSDRNVIVAMGLRGQESSGRAKEPIWSIRNGDHGPSAPTKNRMVYSWLPIHDWLLSDVWNTLLTDGRSVIPNDGITALRRWQAMYQEDVAAGLPPGAGISKSWPYHPAYLYGNERLSCALCILGSMNDLYNGAEYNPDTYRALVQIEIESGWSFRVGLWLGDLRPDLLSDEMFYAFQAIKLERTQQGALL